jgi:DNA-entry nuclease
MEESYKNKVDELVEIGVKDIKEKSISLNNDKPIFKKDDFNLVEGEPVYFDLDELGRSDGGIAILSKYTIPLVIKKNLTYPDPYGWSKTLENKNIFERCHIIAYSLSAKLADKKNIFIGTNTLNTSIMAKIEKRIYNYIMKNNVRILYRVTIKYKGIDQIPTGILIEAQSLDDNFSICQFCYNVQKNVQFNYKDGSIFKDSRLIGKKKSKSNTLLKHRQTKELDEQNRNYVIDRYTNEFHLKDNNCKKLNNVKSMYINETTATKKDLEKAGLIACSNCSIDV